MSRTSGEVVRKQRAFNRVIEGEDVDALAVFDVVAGVDGAEIAQLDAQVVAGNCQLRISTRQTRAMQGKGNIPLLIWILPSSTASRCPRGGPA